MNVLFCLRALSFHVLSDDLWSFCCWGWWILCIMVFINRFSATTKWANCWHFLRTLVAEAFKCSVIIDIIGCLLWVYLCLIWLVFFNLRTGKNMLDILISQFRLCLSSWLRWILFNFLHFSGNYDNLLLVFDLFNRLSPLLILNLDNVDSIL